MNEKITYENKNNDVICHFNAKMDSNSCGEIEQSLLESIRKTEGMVVFNLQSVDYIASAFLRLCVQVCREKGKGKFSVTNASPTVMKVIKIAGLDEMLSAS